MKTRLLYAYRHRRLGSFVLEPAASLSGESHYRLINVLRELSVNIDAATLGSTVEELFSFAQEKADTLERVESLRAHPDPESVRVNKAYSMHRLSELEMNRRFLVVHLYVEPRQRSYTLQQFAYDWNYRGVSKGIPPVVRVRHSAGPEALGKALLSLLPYEPRPAKRKAGPPNNALQRTRFARR